MAQRLLTNGKEALLFKINTITSLLNKQKKMIGSTLKCKNYVNKFIFIVVGILFKFKLKFRNKQTFQILLISRVRS